MQSLIRLGLTTLVLGCLWGCEHSPRLIPRLILQGEGVGRAFWISAPYIAVVRIITAQAQGPAESIVKDGPKSIQLVRFDVDVENDVKGDLPLGPVSFFFFRFDREPGAALLPEHRYIVSLRREGGVLRSWADATQLKIEVNSGSHTQGELPLDRGAETTIAYILLTPGRDADLAKFGGSLRRPDYGDAAYVYDRLKELQHHPDRSVRDEACLAIATNLFIRPTCLEEAARSTNEGVRRAAAAFLTRDDFHLPERLHANPLFFMGQDWTGDALETLDIFADDMRPEVHKEACALLLTLAPGRTSEHCK